MAHNHATAFIGKSVSDLFGIIPLLGRFNPLADPNKAIERHQQYIFPREGDIARKKSTLIAFFIFLDLNDDFFARFERFIALCMMKAGRFVQR